MYVNSTTKKDSESELIESCMGTHTMLAQMQATTVIDELVNQQEPTEVD